MDWQEFWQGILINWLSDIGIYVGILILGLLVFLKAKYPGLARAVLYGLAGLFLFTGILLGFRAMAALPKSQVTLNNVQAKIKAWLDDPHLKPREIFIADSYFLYLFTLKDGTKFAVNRSKYEFDDKFITLEAVLETSPDQKAVLERMKKEDIKQLTHQIILEMGRAKVEANFSIGMEQAWSGTRPFHPFSDGIPLHRTIPITASLTEDVFIERINELRYALKLAHETIVLGLGRLNEKKALQPE